MLGRERGEGGEGVACCLSCVGGRDKVPSRAMDIALSVHQEKGKKGSVYTRHEAMQTRGIEGRSWSAWSTLLLHARIVHKQECVCGTINRIRTSLDTTQQLQQQNTNKKTHTTLAGGKHSPTKPNITLKKFVI